MAGKKRPPIPDIVRLPARALLIYVLDRIYMLGRTQKRLGQIIQTVNSSDEDE